MSRNRKRGIREFAKLEHASVVQTEVADVRNGSMIMNIDKEFLEILTATDKVYKIHGNVIDRKSKKELRTIERKMDELFHNVVDSEGTFENIVILAHAYSDLAFVYVKTTNKEYFGAIEAHLVKCLQLLEGNLLDPRAILIVIGALNQLASLFRLKCPKMTERSLRQAMMLYLAYTKEEHEYPAPVDFRFVLGLKKPRDTKCFLDHEYIRTLEHLITYYAKYGKSDQYESMIYMYKILNTQLNYMAKVASEQRISWIQRAISLSELFILKGRFKEAKNHLSTANYVMHKFFLTEDIVMECKDPYCENSSCQNASYKTQFNYCTQIVADISRTWGLYGVELMRFSYDRLLQSKNDEFCEAKYTKSDSSTKSDDQSMTLLEYNVGESLVGHCPSFTDKFDILKNYDDARDVFGHAINLLDGAVTFYTPEIYLTDHVKICRDICRAYKYLAYYEGQRDNQINLHEQQIQILENLLQILTEDFDLYRDKWIWYELGIIYSTLMDIKYENVRIGVVTAEAHMELHDLTKNSLRNFQLYLDPCVSSE